MAFRPTNQISDRRSGLRLDYLLRMLARSLGKFGPRQHARHFFGALFADDLADGDLGGLARTKSNRGCPAQASLGRGL
jgi:hypothetical protein